MDVVEILNADPVLLPLSFGVFALTAMGLTQVLLAAHWVRRRRRGHLPKPMTFWTMSNLTPHYPKFGYVSGYVFLAGATVLFTLILIRILSA